MQFEGKTISGIDKCVTDILQKTDAYVVQIIEDISNKVSQILHELDKDGQELFCAVKGYLQTLEQTFATRFQSKTAHVWENFSKNTLDWHKIVSVPAASILESYTQSAHASHGAHHWLETGVMMQNMTT